MPAPLPPQGKRPASANQSSLPPTLCHRFEASFGQDLSAVKIRQDSSLARLVGVVAFAEGQDIHFAPGVYSPGTVSGNQLLAHELTHVVQQSQKTAPKLAEGLVANKPAGE